MSKTVVVTTISTNTVFSVFLVFARVGIACMLMPGIGEVNVPSRWKLLISICLSIIIYNAASFQFPKMPESIIGLFLLIAHEVLVGLCLGLISKLVLSALHVTGMVVSMQSGLSAAMMFSNIQDAQSSIIGNFLYNIVIVLLLLANLHLDFVRTLANSYDVISFMSFSTHYNDFAEIFVKTVSNVWSVGLRLSIPFVIAGLVMFIAMGIMSRLMPQLQMFFLMLPAQIAVFIIIFYMVISSSVVWFLEQYHEIMAGLFGIF